MSPARSDAKVIERAGDVPVIEPSPALRIDDASILEGDNGIRKLMFQVRLTAPSSSTVTVDARSLDTTATLANLDYSALERQVTFAPGVVSQWIVVTVRGDRTIEPDELMLLRLANAQNATVADSEAVGRIVNDDFPSLTIADASVAEGNGGSDSLRFAITLSANSPDTVSFTAATVDGSATAASADYVPTSKAFQLAPGTTSATFTVAVLGDKRVESDEAMVTRLSSLRGAVFADSEAVGTIVDDDLPLLSVADAAVAEGDSASRPLPFQVRLSAPARARIAFRYQTFDGSALVAGADYLPTAGDTAFAVGEDLIVLPVTVLCDTLLEANDRFTFRIIALTGATMIDSTAIGTIANDERVRFTRLSIGVPEFPYGTLPPAFGDLTGDGLPDLPMYANVGGTFVEMPFVRALLGNGNYHGAAWCDYDRDGDMDFVQMPYGQNETPYNRVHLLQNSNGTLSDVAPSLGIDIMGYGETPSWGDFNADGWPDLFLPFYAHVAPFHSYLFLNQGGASFLDASDSSGVALRDLPADRRPEGTSVVDWNGDGTLDLYCGNHLFLNDGDAHFTDVRAATGLPQVFDEGSQFVDFDDDGDFDLYLRTEYGPTLYRNDQGIFTDVTATLAIGPLGWEWGDRWADLDGDGDLDLLYFPPSAEARLLLNQGDGTFREDLAFRGVFIGSSLSSFADIDADGDLDIAVGANGRMIAVNHSELTSRAATSYIKVRVEDDQGKLVMQGATVRLRSIDDPKHPVQSRIVDGGSGYLGQDEYTITFGGLVSGAYDLEVAFPSKPDRERVVGPAQNPALAAIRPGLSGPKLIVVRPGGSVSIQDHNVLTASATRGPVSSRLGLGMASPNPARSSIRIGFTLPTGRQATLSIHDVNGRRVRTLGRDARLAGESEVTWDLRDEAGRRVPAGIYFARLAGDASATARRIVVLH